MMTRTLHYLTRLLSVERRAEIMILKKILQIPILIIILKRKRKFGNEHSWECWFIVLILRVFLGSPHHTCQVIPIDKNFLHNLQFSNQIQIIERNQDPEKSLTFIITCIYLYLISSIRFLMFFPVLCWSYNIFRITFYLLHFKN